MKPPPSNNLILGDCFPTGLFKDFPVCNSGNSQLGSFSFHPFEKNVSCVDCNVAKKLRHSADKN